MNIEEVRALAGRQLTEQEIFFLTLSCNMNGEEIGEVMGISRQRASEVISKAKKKAKAQAKPEATPWIR